MTERQKNCPVNQDKDRLLEKIRVFALDMDGTVYLGEKWIDGAKDFLGRIGKSGRKFLFMTNNSSKGPRDYLEKLDRMGFPITEEEILTSGQVMIWFLKKNYPGKRVFLLGNDLLKQEFADAGVLLDEEHPDVAVAGFDTSLTYAKLTRMCDLVRGGIPYFATHPDKNCPTETGFIPDLGSIMAFIYTSASRWPDAVMGKPNAPIVEYLEDRLKKTWFPDIRRREIAMVGDRLSTDIACGVSAGLTSVLVLSGEAKLSDLADSGPMPDLIYDSVKEIPL